MSFELECPVDFKKVNENKVRLTALWVLIASVLILFTKSWLIAAFLLIDFVLRAFDFGKYSLLNLLSDFTVNTFKISAKPIDQAPKLFAAKIGLAFSAAILTTILTNNLTATLYITAVLTFFAFLESALGFCAGCYVYTFYKKISK